MPEWLELAIAMTLFVGLLASGMPIALAIALPAIVYLVMHGGFHTVKGLGLVSWGSTNNFTLTSIPLFILMAELMQRSGMTFRIYRGLSKLVAVLPGGLLQTNIAGSALFAAMSGSSVATAAAIGSTALPQLASRGYDRRLSAGSLAAGGTLGILIPPSIAMIIYGTFTETSIAKLFIAGVVPGLVLTLMFMIYIAIHTSARPELAPREARPSSPGEVGGALRDLFPFALLLGGTMGSLYLGLVTPTEAAAVGCALALLVAALWGEFSTRMIGEALRSTILISGNILVIVFAAFIFSYAISLGGIGEKLTALVVEMELTRLQFLLALFVLYLILGCFVESIGMIVITVPLLYPLLLNYGIDPIWFGVVLVILVEIGQITPPLGINLFVVQSIWDGKFEDVIFGAVPFLLLMILLLLMLMALPGLALWLPEQMTVRP